MTTEIPKRPTDPEPGQITAAFVINRGALIDHEHAVARVAVEALRLHSHAKALSSVCAMCESLAKIKASGWKP